MCKESDTMDFGISEIASASEFSSGAEETPSGMTDKEMERKLDEIMGDFETPECEDEKEPYAPEMTDEEMKHRLDEIIEGKTPDLPETLELPIDKMKGCPIDGHGGHYDGERGNSNWYPDDNEIPPDRNGTNSEHKNWEEIKKEYNFEKIPFIDGEPDFSEVSKGEVEINDFSDNRDSNFAQADEKLAEERGCTPEEVKKWREENKYTWHECGDCKTMQKVPTEVHGNIHHSGGISRYKEQNE